MSGNLQTANYSGSLHPIEMMFPNIGTAGQIMVTPPLMSAAQQGKYTRREGVRMGRAAERRDEHIRGGIDRATHMGVGPSLRAHPQPDWDLLGITDKEARKQFVLACKTQFNDWGYDTRLLCDGEGHYDFGGMMWLAYRNLVGPDAEAAGLILYDEERAAKYRHKWATYVTVIDPDRIVSPGELAGDPDVQEGKRLDRDGRWVGMYIADQHPAEGWQQLPGWTYVERESEWGRAQCFHHFVKTRGGQLRGMSNLVTILKQSGMLDKFDDAYLGAAIVNQVLSTYVETMASAETVAQQMAPAGENSLSPWAQKLDYYDKAKLRLGGSRIPVMPPGDKVMMTAVNRAIGDPSQFRNGFLRMIASSLNISFEQLSMNFSETNYSSARAALLEVWRGIMTLRTLFTRHVASLIYSAVIEEAFAKGRIKLPAGGPSFIENRAAYTGVAWTGPGMGWIDPQKEAAAYEKLLGMNVTNRTRIAAERGDDLLEILEETEAEFDAAADHNIEFKLPTDKPEAADPADPAEQDEEAPAPARKREPAPAE